MKLNRDQRLAMLWPLWIAGGKVPHRVSYWGDRAKKQLIQIEISLLGDLVYTPMAVLAHGRSFGQKAQAHANRVVKELVGTDIGAGTDEETRRAFEQVKLRLSAGIPRDKAWPAWYVRRSG